MNDYVSYLPWNCLTESRNVFLTFLDISKPVCLYILKI